MKNIELEHRVEIINSKFKCKLGLDWMAGRPRLGRVDRSGCISRFIGPRMTKAKMMFYLDALEEGFEEAERIYSGVIGRTLAKSKNLTRT